MGDYYGAFDAQTIFKDAAPDYEKDDFVLLSGTKVREMLGNGEAPPKEFSHPEVAKILIDYYQGLQRSG